MSSNSNPENTSTGAKDRRPKSMTAESYAKEKKGNASKQFSYNKLVNERSKSAAHQTSTKVTNVKQKQQKPMRPPQPRNDHQEGLLIDLSPVEPNTSHAAAISSTSAAAKRNNNNNIDICILDEPIDVPTEDGDQLDVFQDAVDELGYDGTVARCPPPYQQPPQYSNLFEGPSPQSSPQKTNSMMALNKSAAYSNSSLQANEMIQNLNRQMYQSVNSMSSNNDATNAPHPNRYQRPDPIGASSSAVYASVPYSSSSSSVINPHHISGLGESFGQMSIITPGDNESQSGVPTGAVPKQPLDRNFIAELEKYVSHKDQSQLQVNSVQTLATKDVSPKKNFSDNSQTEMMDRIYGNYASQNNSISGGNATTALIQQMWQDSQQQQPQQNTLMTMTSESSQIYANHNNNIGIPRPTEPPTTIDNTLHNFVAVSNRPPSMIMTSQQQQQQIHHNNYNSVYGSTPGNNYYSTAASIYESCPVAAPSPANALYSNAHLQQPAQQPFAVYDEVAADLLQPTRPAPTVPVLSAQQIKRRMQNVYSDVASIYGDTASIYGDVSAPGSVYADTSSIYGDVIENQKITAFCVEVGPEASVIAARQALMATNWDHRLAVRHFKVGQLMKLGLGARDVCESALARSGWSVEVAASILLEK